MNGYISVADHARVMRKAKIMMVDDEPLNMEVLQVHLEAEGYQHFVRHADSVTAMETIRREQPDVVLLDLVMPEVNGFDILGELRGDRDLHSVPVVVLTSSDDAETKHRALTLGASDFLSKPVDASELALRLRNTLAAREYHKRLTCFDGLTDLPNYRYFIRSMRRSMESIAFSDRTAELVLVNIQRFKAINDSYGTDRGDELLWEFSQRLLAAFGSVEREATSLAEDGSRQPLVARLGSDRFGILLPGPEAQQIDAQAAKCSIALQRLQRLVDVLQLPFLVEGDQVYLNVSAGVSRLTQHTRNVETVINEAETAMMYSREHCDNQFCHYSDRMDAQARELLVLENGLRTAIENGEMSLVYQPKIDVRTNTLNGAEALLRWKHQQLGNIAPDAFIGIAENNGIIVQIGDWVLREGCKQAALWRAAEGEHFRMAVNVSIRQLFMSDFAARIRSILDESGLDPDGLIIELTENMLMDDAERNIQRLKELKDIGVRISIDDFGTGYSSLAYLQRFPIDQLKIDRSFIMEIESLQDPMPIVKAVISLAHDLGLSVVAEGVETELQLKHLQALACEEYQGYYFSKPVPAAEFDKLRQVAALAKIA